MKQPLPTSPTGIRIFADDVDDTDCILIHNDLIDVWMPRLSPSEYVILCFIYCQTVGRQQEIVALSYEEIKAGTGIASDATVAAGLKTLLALDDKGIPTANSILLRIEGTARGQGQFSKTEYFFDQKYSPDIQEPSD